MGRRALARSGEWWTRLTSQPGAVLVATPGALLQALVPGYLKVWGEAWVGKWRCLGLWWWRRRARFCRRWCLVT